MKLMLSAVALLFGLAAAPLQPARLAAQWQGVLKTEAREFRLILKVEERSRGLDCALYAIELGPEAQRCDSVVIENGVVRIAVSSANARFEGKLSPDGRHLEGTWTGSQTGPIRFDRAAAQDAWTADTAKHSVQYVTTNDGVRLEVLDFGGSGLPLLFISGLGASGHAFDGFAPRFTDRYHVYAVTRRGYGLSDRPEPSPAAYETRRLGDDVLAVMDALKLQKPILAGWSAGGIEMGSVASRRPDRVAGVVYLDAGYAYSFYAPGNAIPLGSNTTIAMNDLRAKVRAISTAGNERGPILIDEILNTTIPELEADLLAAQQRMRSAPASAAAPLVPAGSLPLSARISGAVMDNVEKFRTLPVPVLAIYATAEPGGTTPAALEQSRREAQHMRELIDRFKAGNPKARVVEILGAQHAVFRSHPDQVASEMSAFFQELSPN